MGNIAIFPNDTSPINNNSTEVPNVETATYISRKWNRDTHFVGVVIEEKPCYRMNGILEQAIAMSVFASAHPKVEPEGLTANQMLHQAECTNVIRDSIKIGQNQESILFECHGLVAIAFKTTSAAVSQL